GVPGRGDDRVLGDGVPHAGFAQAAGDVVGEQLVDRRVLLSGAARRPDAGQRAAHRLAVGVAAGLDLGAVARGVVEDGPLVVARLDLGNEVGELVGVRRRAYRLGQLESETVDK